MTEVLFAHLVNQFTVLVGQTALVFICMLWIFSIPCEGNLFTAVIITLLQGLCGMSYGKIFNFLLKSCFVLFILPFNSRIAGVELVRYRDQCYSSVFGQFLSNSSS